jgi:hypothetical protein
MLLKNPRSPLLRLMSSPDYSHVTAIEERALRIEGNGPVPCSGLQTEFLERTPGKNARAMPSTIHGVETLSLRAFAPPGSPVD